MPYQNVRIHDNDIIHPVTGDVRRDINPYTGEPRSVVPLGANLLGRKDYEKRLRLSVVRAIEELKENGTIEDQVAEIRHDLKEMKAELQQGIKEIKLDNWSRDKKHFPEVRHIMFQLLGMDNTDFKLKNGDPDWDAAYEAACLAHPEVRKIVLNGDGKGPSDTTQDKGD
jgi:hypothetical protein